MVAILEEKEIPKHTRKELYNQQMKGKDQIYILLSNQNLDYTKFNLDNLYRAGINKIIDNIEFYYDKPYSCESVFKELFDRGVYEEIKKSH